MSTKGGRRRKPQSPPTGVLPPRPTPSSAEDLLATWSLPELTAPRATATATEPPHDYATATQLSIARDHDSAPDARAVPEDEPEANGSGGDASIALAIDRASRAHLALPGPADNVPPPLRALQAAEAAAPVLVTLSGTVITGPMASSGLSNVQRPVLMSTRLDLLSDFTVAEKRFWLAASREGTVYVAPGPDPNLAPTLCAPSSSGKAVGTRVLYPLALTAGSWLVSHDAQVSAVLADVRKPAPAAGEDDAITPDLHPGHAAVSALRASTGGLEVTPAAVLLQHAERLSTSRAQGGVGTSSGLAHQNPGRLKRLLSRGPRRHAAGTPPAISTVDGAMNRLHAPTAPLTRPSAASALQVRPRVAVIAVADDASVAHEASDAAVLCFSPDDAEVSEGVVDRFRWLTQAHPRLSAASLVVIGVGPGREGHQTVSFDVLGELDVTVTRVHQHDLRTFSPGPTLGRIPPPGWDARNGASYLVRVRSNPSSEGGSLDALHAVRWVVHR